MCGLLLPSYYVAHGGSLGCLPPAITPFFSFSPCVLCAARPGLLVWDRTGQHGVACPWQHLCPHYPHSQFSFHAIPPLLCCYLCDIVCGSYMGQTFSFTCYSPHHFLHRDSILWGYSLIQPHARDRQTDSGQTDKTGGVVVVVCLT